VTKGEPYQLTFNVFFDIDPVPEKDVFAVRVGKEVAWTKDMVPTSAYGSWHPVIIDLSSHAGEEVDITLNLTPSMATTTVVRGCM
jgi:hypothetical protein